MAILDIIIAPNKIFREKSLPVIEFSAELEKLVSDMFQTMEVEGAVGLAANMVGILKCVIVIDFKDSDDQSKPICLINPEITWSSNEMQTIEEGSLSYPGISALTTRPNAVKINYQDILGQKHEMEVSGFFATVIQHEIDYLNGKVFVDYLSPMKREILIKKMTKYIKTHTPHVHGDHCQH